MQFTISGTIDQNEKRSFTKTLEAKTEKHALDLLYSQFGQQNGLPRNKIFIKEIKKG